MRPLTAIQLYIIVVLSLLVGGLALADHPEWFQ